MEDFSVSKVSSFFEVIDLKKIDVYLLVKSFYVGIPLSSNMSVLNFSVSNDNELVHDKNLYTYKVCFDILVNNYSCMDDFLDDFSRFMSDKIFELDGIYKNGSASISGYNNWIVT